jgi:ATP-dependent Clp protease protease subunit
MAQNKATKYYSLAVQQDNRTADLYIYGDIVDAAVTGYQEARNVDYGYVSDMSIVKDISDLDVDTIRVHINSMGGLTNEGVSIYNVLRNHPAHIVTMIDGFACSAASIVAMAGDERKIGASSIFMIHNAWSWTSGNAHDMRAQADVLDKISQSAAVAYMRGFVGTREQLDALLEGADHDGTWMDAKEAVKWGFCTGIMHDDSKDGIKQSVMHDIASMVLDAKHAKPSIISDSVNHIINKDVDANNGADIDNTSTAQDDMSIAQKILSMGVH